MGDILWRKLDMTMLKYVAQNASVGYVVLANCEKLGRINSKFPGPLT